MSTTKQIKYTDTSGKETVIDIAVEAVNVENNTFTQANTRENIKSGENLSAIFGKIIKWFSDLKTIAFTAKYTDLVERPTLGSASTQGIANNLLTTESGFALDARQGKNLKEQLDEVNSNLVWKLLKSVTGPIPVVLPEQYSELCVMIFNSDSSQGVQFNIPRISITSNYKRLMSGSAVASGNGIDICAYISFNIEQLNLANFILNGIIVTNSCSLHVYYR